MTGVTDSTRAARAQELIEHLDARGELLQELKVSLDDVARGGLAVGRAPTDATGEWSRVGGYTQVGEALKALGDRVLAAVGLVLVSPLLLVIAIAIRLDSPGPALFSQTRIGRGGRPFRFWKFRGMYADSRRRFPELYDYRYTGEEVRTLRFHPDHDPRITRVGGFIRRTSLDEVPNLINVVLGDMSLVGPRPEIPELLPYYGAAAKTVLSVRPGITSLAKLVGRDHITFEETLELDLRYIRERSLRMDLAIVLGTIWMVTTGRSVGH